jgi:hypothetical protein
VSGPRITVDPSAEDNGLANMLATIMRQNVEDHPERAHVLATLRGRLAIFAEDAEVAITWVFEDGEATVHDGIVGIPDLTIRGGFEPIGDMSRMESFTRPLLSHFPDPRGPVNRSMARALRDGKLRIYGLPRGLPLLLAFGEVMQIA